MASAATTAQPHASYTFPVLRNIPKLGKQTKGEGDALLMPYLLKLEQSTQELQNAEKKRVDPEEMKRILHKTTQEQRATLEVAWTELAHKPKVLGRLKRLLGPVVKHIEKVGASSEMIP